MRVFTKRGVTTDEPWTLSAPTGDSTAIQKMTFAAIVLRCFVKPIVLSKSMAAASDAMSVTTASECFGQPKWFSESDAL